MYCCSAKGHIFLRCEVALAHYIKDLRHMGLDHIPQVKVPSRCKIEMVGFDQALGGFEEESVIYLDGSFSLRLKEPLQV